MARRSLRDRISTDNTHTLERKGKAELAPLTPLASRLVAALNNVASEYDELRMIVGGFVRHHRKDPWSDDEISSTLALVRDHINIILADDVAQRKTHTA